MEIKKAYKNNFSKIQDFLLRILRPMESFNNQWIELIHVPWISEDTPIGYILLDKGEIVGYLGTILRKRKIGKKEYTFCNLTAWAVDENYRKYSLRLLTPLLNSKDMVLTNLTATKEVAEISLSLGFKELEVSQKFLIPLLPGFKSNSIQILFDKAKIIDKINEEDRAILSDHEVLDCLNCLVYGQDEYTYFIIKRVHRHKIPFGYVHYISNLNFFIKNIRIIKWQVVKKLKVLSLIVDSRLIRNKNVGLAFIKRLNRPKVYKSEELSPFEVDNLYSELVIWKM